MASTSNGKKPELSAPVAASPQASASAASSAAPAASVADFKVWNPPRDDAPSSPIPEHPDSHYEHSREELMALYASTQRRLHAMTEGPLLTSKLRNDDAKKQRERERFPRTTIRIKFPDRTMLERTFSSEEKIKSVYKFVRDSLTEEAKPVKFILYQPPRQEYKVSDPEVHDKTLYDLHFSPSSVLLLTFTDPALNRHDVPPPLLPEILAMGRDLASVQAEQEREREKEREAKPPTGGQTLGGAGEGATTAAANGKNLSAEEKKAKLARLLKLKGSE
ncbi:hypothetical protein CALCODRAFT_482650 [Calocera cornea HHB12733]|uniref:UBX domain-containing protein n=1 Tax=Calocera cornea HHB12733 TaxID=1353952 RepID=A0A165GIL3_9BASI|nr:hypothetical protein CALCODRAFT_482650 [Calocera cornea HHB12733]